MTLQLMTDLLEHFSNYGSYWQYVKASDFQLLYNFYCLQLGVEAITLITTRKSLIRDAIEARFPTLRYARLKVLYGKKWCDGNCLVFAELAKSDTRMTFDGLRKQVAINDKAITFVKARWLQSFYLAQRDKMALGA